MRWITGGTWPGALPDSYRLRPSNTFQPKFTPPRGRRAPAEARRKSISSTSS